MELLDLTIAELVRSNVDKRHPFKTMVLGTVEGSIPQLRTVVKRNFHKSKGITFYTDSRSPKVAQIRQNPQVSLLLYHPKKKLQVRISGEAHIASSESALHKSALQSIEQSRSRTDYMTVLPPGHVINDTEVTYGDHLSVAVIQVVLTKMDVLVLDRQGHQRRAYSLESDQWIETTLVP